MVILESSNVTNAITSAVNNTLANIQTNIEQLISQAKTILRNELGRCRPVWAIYTSIHITVCESTLDGLVSSCAK